jgi:hypothetical protein
MRGLALSIVAGGLLAGPVVAQESKDPKEEVLVKPTDDRRDLTLLKRTPDGSLLHEGAAVTYTIPKDWKEIPPHRLQRKIDQRIMTVLGIERADRDLVASIYWMPMDPIRKLSDFVRDAAGPAGEYGEEYETLKTVYGKEKVTLPTKVKVKEIDVYKINVKGGPDRGDKYDGTLFVFEVKPKDVTWLVRVRVSYPKADKGINDKVADEVINGFARANVESTAPPVAPEVGPAPKKVD